MFVGTGTYGEPLSEAASDAHHALNIPHVLGSRELDVDIDEIVGYPVARMHDKPGFSRYDGSFLELIQRPDALVELAGNDLHRLMFGNSHDRATLMKSFQHTARELQSRAPMHQTWPWGMNAPELMARNTANHVASVRGKTIKEQQRRQAEYASRELMYLATRLNLLRFYERDRQLLPPIRKVIHCGHKSRIIHQAACESDWMILRLLSCVLQHAFQWPEISHGFVPFRGVHTAMHQVALHLSAGYRFGCTLDIIDAFPSVHRVRGVQRVARCLRCQHNEGLARAGKSRSRKWRPGSDTGFPEALAHRILDIRNARDAKSGKLIDVSSEGLLQGLAVSPVAFNLVLRELDEKLIASFAKTGVWVIRYADNFILLSNCPEAIQDTIDLIRDACRGFALEIRQETGVTDLWAQNSELDFLGLTISPQNMSAAVRISNKKIDDLAQYIASAASVRRLVAGVIAFFRHYGPHGYIDDCRLELLASKAQEALKQNQAVAQSERAQALVSVEGLARLRARTLK